MTARVQAIPESVYPGLCQTCQRYRTCCAIVKIRGRNYPKALMCSQCRLANEGHLEVGADDAPPVDLREEPRVRRMGRGIKARSPAKHRMPFTF